MATPTKPGAVGSLWRYPVKSMRGEELKAVQVRERGLCGDRAYALVDRSDGKVATAKNPRKWSNLFDFRASFIDPTFSGTQVAPICITLPDGTLVTSEQTDCSDILSRALGREVTLEAVMCGVRGTTTSSTCPCGHCRRVLAGYRRPRTPGYGHGFRFTRGHVFRLCDNPSSDHSHA